MQDSPTATPLTKLLAQSTTKLSTQLISAEDLHQVLAEPNVKLFDVRGTWGGMVETAQQDYEQAHIPGAIFLDWTRHFITQNIPTHLAPIAAKDDAQESFKTLGINQDDFVVLYDHYDHMFAGRIWWAMRYWGFQNVKVLNGNWKYWKAHQLPQSNGANHSAATGDFIVTEQKELKAHLEEIIHLNTDTILLDARGEKNYLGSVDDPRSGHIPRAINIPFRSLLDDDSGLFKSHEELNHLIKSALAHYSIDHSINDIQQAKLISSCGGGYAGTVLLLALQELGISAPLFDDSFSVWKSDPERAIEQG